jgi:hypothetical protein
MEETEIDKQIMETVQEAVDLYRQDNNDWGDDSDLLALTYLSHAYLLKQGWTLLQFIKYLRQSEMVMSLSFSSGEN